MVEITKMSVSVQISGEETAELEECIQKILISQGESNPKKLQQLKTPLKSWVVSLIDKQTVCLSNPPLEENKAIIPEDFSLLRQVKYKIQLGRNEIAQKRRIQDHIENNQLNISKTQSNLNTSTRKHTFSAATLSSEITASNKSYQFSKAKRSLDFSSTVSPGPAVYNVRTSVKENPCHMFAKSNASRSEYLKPIKETPGPGEYNPSKHYTTN